MKKKNENSLLDKFFIQKINESDSYSSFKYSALLSLKNILLKDLARMLNVSYGALRKWRAEKKFWELVDQFHSEYINHLIEHLEKRGKRQKQLADEYFEKPIKEITHIPIPELGWAEFLDLKTYSPPLVLETLERVSKYMESLAEKIKSQKNAEHTKRDPDVAIFFQCDSFLSFLKQYPFPKKRAKQHLSAVKHREETQQKTDHGFLVDSLAMGVLHSEEQRKELIYLAHSLIGNYVAIEMN